MRWVLERPYKPSPSSTDCTQRYLEFPFGVFVHAVIIFYLHISYRNVECSFITYKLGMLEPVFWKTGFRLLKTGFRFLLTFIKIYYYIRQIILCITHCNVCTRKAVSTLICSFSRFSLNEAMNIVYTLCFIEKLYLIKTW